MISYVKIGSYLFYELCGSEIDSEACFDCHVRIIKSYDKLKENRLGIQPEIMSMLIKNNTELFVYFDGDIPLGMMWGHKGSCYIRGPGIPLLHDDDTVYWFWIYTLPEARGKNVFKKLKTSFLSHYKNVKKITALVEPNNILMRNEMKKLKFENVKQFDYAKIGYVSLLLEKSKLSREYKLHLEFGNRYNLIII